MTFGWNGHCEDSFRERRCVQRPGFQQKCKETSSSDTRWVLCHCSAHFWLKKAKTDQKQHRAVLTCVLQIYLSNCLFRRPSTEPGHALMDKASVLNPFFFVGKFWAQPLWWNWYFRALRKDICKNHLELIYFHVLGMYSWKELSSHKGGRNDIAEMMLLFIGGILHLSQFSCPILLNWFVWKEGFRIVDAFPAHKHLFFSFHFHSQPPSNLPKESSTW